MGNPIMKNAFPNWAENEGIFDMMPGAPWAEVTTAEILNTEYFGNHSGLKYCSPLVKHFIGTDGTLSSASRGKLASIVQHKFESNWTHLWETIIAEYNPIHNYDMTETKGGDITTTASGTDNTTKTVNSTDTMQHNTTDTTTHGRTDTVTEYGYGFNSTNQSQNIRDKSSSNESGTTGLSHTGTDTDTVNSNDLTSNAKSSTSQEIENYTLTRSGNIGVTTTQQMLQSERDLWMWNFFEQVFNDVDSVLCLMIYNLREKEVCSCL